MDTDDRVRRSRINRSSLLGLTRPKQTVEVKAKISNSMKRAHREGRAWNIGENRRKGIPSWPEKFFVKVIENNFQDQNYEYDRYLNGFWLDFSWPHKMICVEIDGKQHKDDPNQVERDKRKDAMLLENGWKILRIEWKAMFEDPKRMIEIARNFVDNGPLAQSVVAADS